MLSANKNVIYARRNEETEDEGGCPQPLDASIRDAHMIRGCALGSGRSSRRNPYFSLISSDMHWNQPNLLFIISFLALAARSQCSESGFYEAKFCKLQALAAQTDWSAAAESLLFTFSFFYVPPPVSRLSNSFYSPFKLLAFRSFSGGAFASGIAAAYRKFHSLHSPVRRSASLCLI